MEKFAVAENISVIKTNTETNFTVLHEKNVFHLQTRTIMYLALKRDTVKFTCGSDECLILQPINFPYPPVLDWPHALTSFKWLAS